MKPSDFTIGQIVYVENTETFRRTAFDPANLRENTVAKIGKRWVTLKSPYRPDRFDLEDMRIDGGDYSSPGRVWVSVEEAVRYHEARVAWEAFSRRISGHAQPPGIGLAEVRQLSEICGIDLDAAIKQDAR